MEGRGLRRRETRSIEDGSQEKYEVGKVVLGNVDEQVKGQNSGQESGMKSGVEDGIEAREAEVARRKRTSKL